MDVYFHTIDERALADSIHDLRLQIMSKFDEAKAATALALAAVQALSDKDDQIIAKLIELRDGGGATVEQLDELIADANAITDAANAQAAQDDAALAG
jgi:uncharacterized coiled-coil DUF342 family protein